MTENQNISEPSQEEPQEGAETVAENPQQDPQLVSGKSQKTVRPKNGCRTLFWSFLKIGLFTFGGGYAMIPLIRREVVDRLGWIEEKHFLELLTLAQTSPGSLALNAAVFVGYKVKGHRGALSAVAGITLPAFIIVLLVTTIFHQVSDNRVVAAVLRGMRPAVVALIAAPVYSLVRRLGWARMVIAAAALAAMLWCGLSPKYFILIGGIGGALYTFYQIRRQR